MTSIASVSLDVALCTPNVCNLDERILNSSHFIIQSCGYLCLEVNSTVDRFIRLIISLIPCIYTLISPRGACLFCVLNFRRLRSSASFIEVEMGHYPNLFQHTYTHTHIHEQSHCVHHIKPKPKPKPKLEFESMRHRVLQENQNLLFWSIDNKMDNNNSKHNEQMPMNPHLHHGFN